MDHEIKVTCEAVSNRKQTQIFTKTVREQPAAKLYVRIDALCQDFDPWSYKRHREERNSLPRKKKKEEKNNNNKKKNLKLSTTKKTTITNSRSVKFEKKREK